MKTSTNNRFKKTHELAKVIRSQYSSYREAFKVALAKIDRNGIDKNSIIKRKPIISVFVKRDNSIRVMVGITGIKIKVKGTGYRIKKETPAIRVFDLKMFDWRTMPTDYRLLEIRQTWNIFALVKLLAA